MLTVGNKEGIIILQDYIKVFYSKKKEYNTASHNLSGMYHLDK